MRASRFSPDVCGRLIGAIRAGEGVEEACAGAGISPRTFQSWMQKGVRPDSKPEYRQFRADVEAARVRCLNDSLSDAELVRMLEKKAREGSIKAIELLLKRPWERSSRSDGDEKPGQDPLAEVDELASRRQQRAVGA